MPEDSNKLATYKYVTEFLKEGSNLSLQCPTKKDLIDSYSMISKPPYGTELDSYEDNQCVRIKDIALGITQVIIVNNKGGVISFENDGTTYYESDTPADIRAGTYIKCRTTAEGFDRLLWWTGEADINVIDYLVNGSVTVTANYYDLQYPSEFEANWESQLINITGFDSKKNTDPYVELEIDKSPEWMTQSGSSGTSILVRLTENTDLEYRSFVITGHQRESNLNFSLSFSQRGRRTNVGWNMTDPIEVDWKETKTYRYIEYDGYFQNQGVDVQIVPEYPDPPAHYDKLTGLLTLKTNTDESNSREYDIVLVSTMEGVDIDNNRSTIHVKQSRKLEVTYDNRVFEVDPVMVSEGASGGVQSVRVTSTATKYENGNNVGLTYLEYTWEYNDDWFEVQGNSDGISITINPNESELSKSGSIQLLQESTGNTASVSVYQNSRSGLTTLVMDQYGNPISGFRIYYNGEYVGETDINGIVTYGSYSGENIEVTGNYDSKGYRSISGIGIYENGSYGTVRLSSSNLYRLTIRCNVKEFYIEYDGITIDSDSGETYIELEYGSYISGLVVGANGYNRDTVNPFTMSKDREIEITLIEGNPMYGFKPEDSLYPTYIEYNELKGTVNFYLYNISALKSFDTSSIYIEKLDESITATAKITKIEKVSQVDPNNGLLEYIGEIEYDFKVQNTSYTDNKVLPIFLACTDSNIERSAFYFKVISQYRAPLPPPTPEAERGITVILGEKAASYYSVSMTVGSTDNSFMALLEHSKRIDIPSSKSVNLRIINNSNISKPASVRILIGAVSYRTSEYGLMMAGNAYSSPTSVEWKAGEGGQKTVIVDM